MWDIFILCQRHTFKDDFCNKRYSTQFLYCGGVRHRTKLKSYTNLGILISREILLYFFYFSYFFFHSISMASTLKSRKSPWVPPPGRSRRQDKAVNKSHSVSSQTISPCVTTKKNLENTDDDISEMSLEGSAASDLPSCELNINLNSIKEEMKLFSTHFTSMKQILVFLNGFIQTTGIQDRVIAPSLYKVDNRIKEFIYEFDELEYSITFVENILPESDKTGEYFKAIKLKESLLSKLLESYSNVVMIFQTVIQKKVSEDLAKFQKDHDLIRKQLQISEKKCQSQEAVITDLERRLSIFQGKTSTIESYASTLEATKEELQKQLSFKDAQIKYLNSELSQLAAANKDDSNNEKLLEIIEEIKKVSHAEKTALRKALKLEKLHVKQREESIQKLQKDMQNKDDMIFDIAAQRDKLKFHLTVANNNIIEGKNQVEEIKSRNLKLQNEQGQKESSLKKEMQEISNTLKTKTKDIYELEEENIKLKKLTETLKNDLVKNRDELKAAKSKLLDPTIYLSENHGDRNEETVLDEIKHLISLLKDSQAYFKNIQTVLHASGDNMQNVKDYSSITTALVEVKEYLLEIKELCGTFPKENNLKLEWEKQIKELQKLYSETSKENDTLKSEIEEMKSSRVEHPQITNPGNYPSAFGLDSQFSTKNLQMELSLKTEENWRLKQRERDLEHQLEEVKEKLQKREIENGKLFSLEEELRTKKSELSILEKRREQEMERSSSRIKELQEAFDKKSSEYDSLAHYVQALKSSYMNVFGNS